MSGGENVIAVTGMETANPHMAEWNNLIDLSAVSWCHGGSFLHFVSALEITLSGSLGEYKAYHSVRTLKRISRLLFFFTPTSAPSDSSTKGVVSCTVCLLALLHIRNHQKKAKLWQTEIARAFLIILSLEMSHLIF